MKICWDTLSELTYNGKGTWIKQLKNRKMYYIEVATCKFCGESFLTDKHIPKKFCSRSCSMKGKFDGENNPFYGKTHSKEVKAFLSIKNSGSNSYWYGRKHSAETKEKLSKLRKGKANPFYGKTHTPDVRRRVSEKNSGENNFNYGKKWSTEQRLKISKSHKGKFVGKNNPNWKGGITKERQSFYATRKWKKAVRMVWQRDNATCRLCGTKKSDTELKFHIHHIVSFKVSELRADVDNLILLCRDCHVWVHSKDNVKKCFIKEFEGGKVV